MQSVGHFIRGINSSHFPLSKENKRFTLDRLIIGKSLQEATTGKTSKQFLKTLYPNWKSKHDITLHRFLEKVQYI